MTYPRKAGNNNSGVFFKFLQLRCKINLQWNVHCKLYPSKDVLYFKFPCELFEIYRLRKMLKFVKR